MPFIRPSLADLVVRVQQDFESRLDLNGAVLRRAMVRIFARVQAGAAHMLHGHIEWVARQLFADTADLDALQRTASIWGVVLKPATYASGPVEVTGENGSVIPVGTRLVRADGAVYLTDLDAVISGGLVVLTVTSELAAADGETEAGVELSFESPIAGVDAGAFVAAGGVTGGADAETAEELRSRFLERLRNPPQGGSAADYARWAREVPGVTRSWVYPQELGAGTVTIRFVRDNDASLIPSAGEVADVQQYIDERRPVTANAIVAAPIAKTWAFSILLAPDTTAGRDAVTSEIVDLFQSRGEPGLVVPLSDVRTAVGTGARSVGATYTMSSPSADLTHATGELPVPGTFTWT